MKGIHLKFYMYELQTYRGILMYEWLLDFAKKHQLEGGSAFRAIAGYGRSQRMYEEHFFELASNVPVEVAFILTEKETQEFLELLKKESIDLFYVSSTVEYGWLGRAQTKLDKK